MFDRALDSKYDAFTNSCEKYSLEPNELDVLDNENTGKRNSLIQKENILLLESK
jgi:hypothetical protein